jgi:hypothetical protein
VKATRIGGLGTAGLLVFVLVGLPACSSISVEDVCEAIDECAIAAPADCVEDGQLLERRVERAGCEEPFDAYLACLYDAPCAWLEACVPERERLEACVGEFPP